MDKDDLLARFQEAKKKAKEYQKEDEIIHKQISKRVRKNILKKGEKDKDLKSLGI